MITSDSKLAAKEKLLKEREIFLKEKVEEGTKPVADQQVDLKKKFLSLTLNLDNSIKQSNNKMNHSLPLLKILHKHLLVNRY